MYEPALLSEVADPIFRPVHTVGQASAYFGVHPVTLRKWDRTGKLKPQQHPINGYLLNPVATLTNIADAITPAIQRRGNLRG